MSSRSTESAAPRQQQAALTDHYRQIGPAAVRAALAIKAPKKPGFTQTPKKG